MELVHGGPRLTDPSVVGHKFARQAILREAGFPVPEFFCVPVEAFDAALADASAPTPAAADADAVTWAEQQRAAILALGVSEPLACAIDDGFERLAGQHGLVAVRACVVSNHPAGHGGESQDAGEDSAGDPFAGLSDSFLYVSREKVARRVAECWASAFTARAVMYRQQRGVDPRAARVAVGVQRMIEGERSFVAFTRDPRDGADRRMIAAAYGIGEGVVQERADIDHFFVDPRTGSVQAAVAAKARMVGLDPDRPGAGPRTLRVPAALADTPVLTDDEVRSVCALAERTERHFGVPQDIEGTLTTDGKVHLVQARPMVPAAAAAAGTSGQRPFRRAGEAAAGESIWTNHNLTESFPGVTCTLTFSQARQFYQLAFGGFYRRMGVPARKLRRHRAELRQMIGRIDGRVYYRLDAWYTLHGLIPAFAPLRTTWQRALGLSGSEITDAPPLPTSPWAISRTIPRALVMLASHPWAVRGFLRWWDRFSATAGELDGCDPGELAARHRQVWSEFDARWHITLVNSFFLLASKAVVDQLLTRWADSDPALLAGLLHGGKENRSLAALRSALALAEQMRADPALRHALQHDDDRTVYERIRAGQFGTEVATALSGHLRRYGDRTVHDLKLEVRTPRQDPSRIIAMLSPLVEQDLTAAGSREDERSAGQDGAARLRRACPGPARRWVLQAALAALRWFIRVREDTRLCRSQLYGLTRDILWRLGGALTAAGWLDEAADITHLTVPEVLAAADGTGDREGLRGLVAQRRAELDASAARPAPPAYLRRQADGSYVDAAPSGLARQEALGAPGQAGPAARTLHGLASSSGVVRARARVVLEPTVAADQCRDRILIARETDPGWLYLMAAAKGVVVERGSLLSHTAITGRLLGIPAVVAVRDATTHIADDCWLEIDGAAGTVRLLAEQDSR